MLVCVWVFLHVSADCVPVWGSVQPPGSQRFHWQSAPPTPPLLILSGLNTTQHLPAALSASSHAPASLARNGFTLPYNPFTPQCSQYPLCCLSLSTGRSPPISTAHTPPPPPPSNPVILLLPLLFSPLYPFRSVSVSLGEGD